jgi:hypothetical protein
MWRLLLYGLLEIIIDLPFGFPINNIISLSDYTETSFCTPKPGVRCMTLRIHLGIHSIGCIWVQHDFLRWIRRTSPRFQLFLHLHKATAGAKHRKAARLATALVHAQLLGVEILALLEGHN